MNQYKSFIKSGTPPGTHPCTRCGSKTVVLRDLRFEQNHWKERNRIAN